MDDFCDTLACNASCVCRKRMPCLKLCFDEPRAPRAVGQRQQQHEKLNMAHTIAHVTTSACLTCSYSGKKLQSCGFQHDRRLLSQCHKSERSRVQQSFGVIAGRMVQHGSISPHSSTQPSCNTIMRSAICCTTPKSCDTMISAISGSPLRIAANDARICVRAATSTALIGSSASNTFG